MKLKYYLRGIGIGVIVATMIMTVSSVIHNNNLSDEMIIKEAQKLGMIMPENTEDNSSLWGNSTESESESETTSQNTEADNSSETQSLEDTQIPEDTLTSEETQAPEDAQTSEETQTPENTQTPDDTQTTVDENMAVITVDDSDAARHVSEKLQAAGLIEDAVDFKNYLADKGYAKDIKSGTFEIPKGSSYEEICDIIIKK